MVDGGSGGIFPGWIGGGLWNPGVGGGWRSKRLEILCFMVFDMKGFDPKVWEVVFFFFCL